MVPTYLGYSGRPKNRSERQAKIDSPKGLRPISIICAILFGFYSALMTYLDYKSKGELKAKDQKIDQLNVYIKQLRNQVDSIQRIGKDSAKVK